jgi:hypothetical protein
MIFDWKSIAVGMLTIIRISIGYGVLAELWVTNQAVAKINTSTLDNLAFCSVWKILIIFHEGTFLRLYRNYHSVEI